MLFSAHGLPEVIVAGGDPYQFQVERTVADVLRALRRGEIDYRICYQSRATPQRWIGPSTEERDRGSRPRQGRRAGRAPIAFVSEHTETLVELDVEYREFAEKLGIGITSAFPHRTMTRASSPRWQALSVRHWRVAPACAAMPARAPARPTMATART